MDSRPFKPEWISPPGDTISALLDEKRVSRLELAQHLGQTPAQLSDLMRGRIPITDDTARKLADVLGAPADFWLSRETRYREDLSRLALEIATRGKWLKELPVKDMTQFGWLGAAPSSPVDKIAACLQFFGVSNEEEWRENYHDVLDIVAFRTSPSFESEPGAVAAWLRQGEIESESIECARWDSTRFAKALRKIRALTRKKKVRSFIPELKKLCAECGVAVVIVRAPNGCRASGATRFLSSTKAMLLLSFRYLSDDHFWFTFFHEAGHLLLHADKGLFIEGVDLGSNKEEDEANRFSADVLIPAEFQSAVSQVRIETKAILRLAMSIGVSAGILVGQLQHAGRLRHNQLNGLKTRFDWDELESL